MELILNVQSRQRTGSEAKLVRAEGYVPAVVYGQGRDAKLLKFREIDLVRLLRVGAASQLIELHGLENDPTYVLMREVQRHPTRRNLLHVDFYEVQMNVAVRTEVPVILVGTAPAVEEGAVLLHNIDRLDIECLPRAIPESITVDISGLAHINDVIRVSDLTIPEDVIVHHGPDESVVSLTIPRSLAEEEEEGEEEMEPMTVADVEVISEAEEEEEG